jgi:hypothetical protein
VAQNLFAEHDQGKPVKHFVGSNVLCPKIYTYKYNKMSVCKLDDW